jgi:arylsulfatase A-like enzyme
MFRRRELVKAASAAGPVQEELAERRVRPLALVGVSAWCGLSAGLLEVAAIVLRKYTFGPSQLYGISRYFVWVIPLANLALFLALGTILSLVAAAWPRRGQWLAVRSFCALTPLPAALVAAPQIHTLAWLVIMLGIATNIARPLERRARAFRRLAWISFPAAILAVVVLAAGLWGGDRLKQRRERLRPLPPAGSPNLILLVLDTVAADHMGIYGYSRRTSPALAELAERGIRFDSARSTASWTLPAHASMFTGRWPHELSASWRTPLDESFPTIAEFLSAQGYATAGFVGNTQYCASDSGLGRGFTEYHDFIFPYFTALRMAVLVNRTLQGIEWLDDLVENQLDLSNSQCYAKHVAPFMSSDRKKAATVNRELLHWLARRQPDRPFFAFLNYLDAHWPYWLPDERVHRFGFAPRNSRQTTLIDDWGWLDKRGVSHQELDFVQRAYDDCIATLDEEIGKLFDQLERRRALEATWVIIVSDHGESFGEHPGVFCHGTSLYQTELHVPLLIIPPRPVGSRRVVTATVSLRDVAATIADVLGLKEISRFPGESLARFWQGSTAKASAASSRSEPALSEVVPDESANMDPSPLPQRKSPLGALLEQGWTYIRRDADAREELFHVAEDAHEQNNLASDPAALSTLERMRATLSRLTGGPLTPKRFKP